MIKLISLTLLSAGLLSACSSNQNNISLNIQELDRNHYNAEVSVSHFGNTADSSYLREIHRREIQLKFAKDKLCNGGINIARPTNTHEESASYQLNYVVTCTSS